MATRVCGGTPDAPCSVPSWRTIWVLARRPEGGLVYKCILVPFDGTATSQQAMKVGVATAAWSGARLVLLFVERVGVPLDSADTVSELNAVERDADALLGLVQPLLVDHDLPVERVSSEVRAGAVDQRILEAAEEHLCDVIVMGTHGRRGLQEVIIGSTTERVLRNTSASVYVIRPEGYPYLRD